MADNNPNNYDSLVEIMMTDDAESLDEFILNESERDEVLSSLGGDQTLINYMFLFEEFLEQHDLYLFKGWEKAQFIGRPKIEKFWVTFHLLVNSKSDMRGAKRINDALKQGEVIAKDLPDGKGKIVQFTVLKRDLDRIEADNQEKIEKLSLQALDEL